MQACDCGLAYAAGAGAGAGAPAPPSTARSPATSSAAAGAAAGAAAAQVTLTSTICPRLQAVGSAYQNVPCCTRGGSERKQKRRGCGARGVHAPQSPRPSAASAGQARFTRISPQRLAPSSPHSPRTSSSSSSVYSPAAAGAVSSCACEHSAASRAGQGSRVVCSAAGLARRAASAWRPPHALRPSMPTTPPQRTQRDGGVIRLHHPHRLQGRGGVGAAPGEGEEVAAAGLDTRVGDCGAKAQRGGGEAVPARRGRGEGRHQGRRRAAPGVRCLPALETHSSPTSHCPLTAAEIPDNRVRASARRKLHRRQRPRRRQARSAGQDEGQRHAGALPLAHLFCSGRRGREGGGAIGGRPDIALPCSAAGAGSRQRRRLEPRRGCATRV